MRTFLAAALSGFSLVASASYAAEFTFLTGKSDNRPTYAPHFVKCNIRMEGAITTGDAAKFEALLAKHADDFAEPERVSIATLCLNSPGGSLFEGIKLAESIRKDRPYPRDGGIPLVVTRLEAGASCESACAIAFMAGTLDVWEEEPIPQRSMHPTARLGFHAPALVVGEGQYSQDQITDAFDISVNAIAEIQRVMNVGADPDGRIYRGTETWMKGTLIEAMLKTPASDMRYISTVDDAGRWGIEVFPIRQHVLDYKSGYRACINSNYWSIGASSIGAWELDETERGNPFIGQVQHRQNARVLSYTLDHMKGTSCEIFTGLNGEDWMYLEAFVPESEEYDGPTIWFEGTGPTQEVNVGTDALMFYPPDTPLAALFPKGQQADTETETTTQPPKPVEWAPRFGGSKITLWDHNGSQMAWESKGAQRWIWYFKPRAALLAAGIAPGTLLFDGEMSGGVLSGTARRFSQNCGTLEYAVSDRPEGTRVVLEGAYQQRDENCQPTGQRQDKLVFDYKAVSP